MTQNALICNAVWCILACDLKQIMMQSGAF